MSKTKSAKPDTNVSFRTSIGGQALIEGILMRGPAKQAIVCRTQDGMVEKVEELHLVKEKHPILGWPLIRGVVVFLDSMVKGMKALTYSADLLPEDEQEEPGKIDLWIERHFGEEKGKNIIIGTAVVLGIALSIVLFILIPTLLAGLTDSFIHSPVVRNLFEGLLRIVIFLLYLWGVAHMKDVERMFAYHGAEHKTIFCYEKGLPLTVENVRPQSRFHPRCGTSFLFVVVIISILVFSLVSLRVGLWDNPWVRVGLRLLRCGLLLLDGLLGHGAGRGVLFLLGEVFLPDGVDGLRQRRAADTRDDRQRGQQRRDLESGVLAAAPDLLLGLLQRRPGRLLGRGFKAVVHLFIVIFHGSALLFGVSVQKSGSGRSSIWLTRFNDSLRRIYGWNRKLISTKSGALPTSPIVVLHPACRMAARQAS